LVAPTFLSSNVWSYRLYKEVPEQTRIRLLMTNLK